MKFVTIDEFIRLALSFYKTIGIDPCNRSKLGILHKLNFYFGFINLFIVLTFEILYVLVAFKNNENFIEATMTMSYIGFVFIASIKVILIWKRKSILIQFIEDMESIFPKTLEEQKKYNIDIHLKHCKFITKVFSGLYMVLIWTYNLIPILQYSVQKHVLAWPNVQPIIPYTIYIPWELKSDWRYFGIYILEVYAGHTSAAGLISVDLLLYSMASQIIMHFKHVADELETFVAQAKECGKLYTIASKQDMDFLQKQIAYHVQLYRLTETMNNVFGLTLLLNFMTSSFIICFVGFQMTIGVSPVALFKLTLFLVSSLVEVYLICQYSQQLIDASFNIAKSAYDQKWFNAEISYKKMLVLIMIRAQRPASLKATNFLPISLVTMTQLMQMSYKFFALLRTMYSK